MVSKYFSMAVSSWFFSTFCLADDKTLLQTDGKSEFDYFQSGRRLSVWDSIG